MVNELPKLYKIKFLAYSNYLSPLLLLNFALNREEISMIKGISSEKIVGTSEVSAVWNKVIQKMALIIRQKIHKKATRTGYPARTSKGQR